MISETFYMPGIPIESLCCSLSISNAAACPVFPLSPSLGFLGSSQDPLFLAPSTSRLKKNLPTYQETQQDKLSREIGGACFICVSLVLANLFTDEELFIDDLWINFQGCKEKNCETSN